MRAIIARLSQILLVLLQSCILGSLMQLCKLSSVDAAARQFNQTSHFSKQSFLTSYGLFKASANLALGWWVSSHADVKWGGLTGWLLAIGVPVMAALAQNWLTVVAANAVVGFQQGLAWTCTVLLIVPLFRSDQRGLALGLNEALGYVCLAAMAPVYGVFERHLVQCQWVSGVEDASAECLATSQGECSLPDAWVPECVGQCMCGSYTGIIVRVGGVLIAIGLSLCVVLILLQVLGPSVNLGPPTQNSKQQLRGASNQSTEAATARRGGYYSVQTLDGGEVEMGMGHTQAGKGGTGGNGALASKGGAVALEAGRVGGAGVDGDVGDGVKSPRVQQAGREFRKGAGEGEAVGPPASKGAAFLRFTLGIRSGVPLVAPWRARGKGGGTAAVGVSGLPDPGVGEQLEQGRGGGGGPGGGVQGPSVLGRGLCCAGVKKGGRSTLILCIAGCACNCVASLAWGMLLSWARDLLLIPGPARDMMASTYQFMMAIILLIASHISDRTGRRWWVVGGLCSNAAGLLTAACGAGFHGRLLLGVPTAPAALQAAGGGAEQQLLQYGYLQLASCLLGIGTGSMYGTMAAGVVDHSLPSDQAINMATFRFWRDLGYSMGSLAGLAADASSTEVSMLCFGGLSLAIASCVALFYEEAGAQAPPPPPLPSLDAALELSDPENEDAMQRRTLLERSQPHSA